MQRHPGVPECDNVNKELLRMSRVQRSNRWQPMTYTTLKGRCLCSRGVLLVFKLLDLSKSRIDLLAWLIHQTTTSRLREMKADFIDAEAIENTVKIAELCNLEIPYGKLIIPTFPQQRANTGRFLKELTLNSIDRVKANDQAEVIKRINYELSIINQKGLLIISWLSQTL